MRLSVVDDGNAVGIDCQFSGRRNRIDAFQIFHFVIPLNSVTGNGDCIGSGILSGLTLCFPANQILFSRYGIGYIHTQRSIFFSVYASGGFCLYCDRSAFDDQFCFGFRICIVRVDCPDRDINLSGITDGRTLFAPRRSSVNAVIQSRSFRIGNSDVKGMRFSVVDASVSPGSDMQRGRRTDHKLAALTRHFIIALNLIGTDSDRISTGRFAFRTGNTVINQRFLSGNDSGKCSSQFRITFPICFGGRYRPHSDCLSVYGQYCFPGYGNIIRILCPYHNGNTSRVFDLRNLRTPGFASVDAVAEYGSLCNIGSRTDRMILSVVCPFVSGYGKIHFF